MADARPQPLVPAEVDLRGCEFMPLFGERLRRSEFNQASAEAKWAGLMLWWASWWEHPAASLPNNDAELARLADCKGLRAFNRVRACAMRGWVLCSDNRWYHPVLASSALDAHAKRIAATVKGRNGANKRWGNKGLADATSNATATTLGSTGNARANAPAKVSDSTGNSKGNESSSNKQLPVTTGTSTAQPPPTSTPVEEPPRSTPPPASSTVELDASGFPAGGVAAFAKAHGVKVRKQPESFE